MKKYFNNKTLLYVPILILVVPLLGMQLSSDMQWSLFDFVVVGALLYSAIGLYFLISQKLKTNIQKFTVAAAILLTVIFIWAELAVGVFTKLGN